MQSIHEVMRWFLTPSGRIAAAAILFATIWAIKNVPWVKKMILKDDQAKLCATVITGMAPAAILLLDQSVPASDAWYNAFLALLGAMGIQGGLKAALGEQLKGKLKLGNRNEQD